MLPTDRRSGQDRRALERKNVTIDIEWQSGGARKTGTISDLNEAGCFVLSSGEVTAGDEVKIFLPLGEGMKVEMAGEVRNQVFEIGFALRFDEPTEAQINVIKGLMAKYGEYR